MREWLITLLLFSGVVLGLTAFQGELFKAYGQDVESLSYLNVSDEVFGNITTVQTTLNQTTGQVNVFSVISASSTILVSIFRFIFFVPTVMVSILAGISETLLLPWWFLPMVMGIIFIIIMYQIATGLGRFRV